MTIADLETLTRFLTNSTTTSVTAANLLILENKYYEEITGKILSETSGAQWQFGDFNYTEFPTFTITLRDSDPEYDLKEVSTTPLTIMGLEVQDNEGNWHVLRRTTLRRIHEQGIGQEDYQETDGLPNEYEIRDNMIVLYPAPDNGISVTLSGGLKVFYLRTADIFTSAEVTTGTKEPGFPSPWHWLLSYGPAYDIALTANLPTANAFRDRYEKGLKDMLGFISRRDQATRPIMTNRGINYI